MAKKIHVRPGKGQSKVGFVVGIIFCLIGLVVVVGTLGMGSVIIEVVIGMLLVGVGIWGLRKSRKNV